MIARTFTITCKPTELFDALAGNPDLQQALGGRMVELLLLPAGFMSAVGLAMYGITVEEASPPSPDQTEGGE